MKLVKFVNFNFKLNFLPFILDIYICALVFLFFRYFVDKNSYNYINSKNKIARNSKISNFGEDVFYIF